MSRWLSTIRPARHDILIAPRRAWHGRGPACGCALSFSTSHLALRQRREGQLQGEAPVDDSDTSKDPRISDAATAGRQISDDFASIRSHYATPKHPIVLAHGLLGFSELKLGGAYLPPIQYWHGIRDALVANGATVLAPAVPPSSAIEHRAAKLAEEIATLAERGDDTAIQGRGATKAGSEKKLAAGDTNHNNHPVTSVNIIAHSMGGLDARHMISHALLPPSVRVASLTTIATPHRGSAFADYVLQPGAGPIYLPKLYGLLSLAGFGTEAFRQLTRAYMRDDFNPRAPDDPQVQYFSFGAAMGDHRSNGNNSSGSGNPNSQLSVLSPFRLPHRIVAEAEGPNDGLVSVASSRWGEYHGTLLGVSHLDLINWSNRVRWAVRGWVGAERQFNAIALYLDIMDMLAKKGL